MFYACLFCVYPRKFSSLCLTHGGKILNVVRICLGIRAWKRIQKNNKILNYKNKIIFNSLYCADVKHQSQNFGVAVQDDDDRKVTVYYIVRKVTQKRRRCFLQFS